MNPIDHTNGKKCRTMCKQPTISPGSTPSCINPMLQHTAAGFFSQDHRPLKACILGVKPCPK